MKKHADKLKQALENPNARASIEYFNELYKIFENETYQVMKDFRDGVLSENVKHMLFSYISDIQPMPNLRIELPAFKKQSQH